MYHLKHIILLWYFMPFPLGSAPPLSKEGLWQNWMSTSGSAQLESEANHVHPSGSVHHHHHHHHGNCNGDANAANGDGNGKASCSIPCDCHDNHGSGHAHPSGAGTYRSGCTADHNHGRLERVRKRYGKRAQRKFTFLMYTHTHCTSYIYTTV